MQEQRSRGWGEGNRDYIAPTNFLLFESRQRLTATWLVALSSQSKTITKVEDNGIKPRIHISL
jgi:hypothetical protein